VRKIKCRLYQNGSVYGYVHVVVVSRGRKPSKNGRTEEVSGGTNDVMIRVGVITLAGLLMIIDEVRTIRVRIRWYNWCFNNVVVDSVSRPVFEFFRLCL
jgi:hypothetical protein